MKLNVRIDITAIAPVEVDLAEDDVVRVGPIEISDVELMTDAELLEWDNDLSDGTVSELLAVRVDTYVDKAMANYTLTRKG